MNYIYAKTNSTGQVVKCNGFYSDDVVDAIVAGLNSKYGDIVTFYKVPYQE